MAQNDDTFTRPYQNHAHLISAKQNHYIKINILFLLTAYGTILNILSL